MKKFLRFNLPRSEKEVPLALDAAILASAALHARSLRRRRLLAKLIFSGSAAAAAAAVIAVSGVFSTAVPIQPQENQLPAQIAAADTIQTKAVPPQESNPITISNSELLALADTTTLEQESFNLASMAEFSFDSDNFTI